MNRASNGRDECVASLSATESCSAVTRRIPDIRMGDGPVALLLARPNRHATQGHVELTTRNGVQVTAEPTSGATAPVGRSLFQWITAVLSVTLHRRVAEHR
ncbi:hypothetical protein DVT68_17640 [Dyella solisilvae]|uniref:Uncharacterized protein n=2 Tax=Dyella solisilvae TaxID=1920168 RepID=A0A370K3E4_9GAMM|nr:hypothetical protein DVT68_17640 [Dyella solisilvae]